MAKFPKRPEISDSNPFVDPKGNSLFAEETAPPSKANEENPFSSPESVTETTYEVDDWESQLVPRTNVIFGSGIIGFSVAILGVVASAISVAANSNWIVGLYFSLPLQCVSLAVSLPAWVMGRQDLKAMRSGAMSDQEISRLRRGYRLGVGGVVIACGPIALLIASLIGNAFLF